MLRREISTTFAGTVASTGLSIGTAIILARFLGPANRGLLALALLVPRITATLCRLGQETVNAVFAGLYKDKRSGLFLQSIIITTIGGLISVLIVLAFFFWLPIGKGQFGQLTPTMIYLACLVAPMLITGALMTGLLRGVGRIITAAKIGVAQAAFRLALAALFIVVLGCRLRFSIFLAVISSFVGVALSILALRPYVTLRPSRFSPELFKKSLGFGWTVSLATFATFLIYRLDQGMLGYMVSAEEVGLYVVAVALAEQMRMLPNSIALAFLPRLANELSERQAQVPAVFRYSTVVSAGAMLIAAILGVPAILLLFGRAYSGSIPSFLILLPGIAAFGGASILSSDLFAREKPRYSVIWSYSGLCVNVALNLLLIPIMGIAGAALASSVTYALTCTLTLMFYRRESGTPMREMIPRWKDCMYVLVGVTSMAGQAMRRVRGKGPGKD